MILLDTNIISKLIRPEPDPVVGDWLTHLGYAPLAATAITVSEIVFGIERVPNGKRKSALQERF